MSGIIPDGLDNMVEFAIERKRDLAKRAAQRLTDQLLADMSDPTTGQLRLPERDMVRYLADKLPIGPVQQAYILVQLHNARRRIRELETQQHGKGSS
jgi:hypothetical protein